MPPSHFSECWPLFIPNRELLPAVCTLLLIVSFLHPLSLEFLVLFTEEFPILLLQYSLPNKLFFLVPCLPDIFPCESLYPAHICTTTKACLFSHSWRSPTELTLSPLASWCKALGVKILYKVLLGVSSALKSLPLCKGLLFFVIWYLCNSLKKFF